jgi:hypothetical protein
LVLLIKRRRGARGARVILLGAIGVLLIAGGCLPAFTVSSSGGSANPISAADRHCGGANGSGMFIALSLVGTDSDRPT